MTIRNTRLSGTDWPFGQSPVKAADMNETNDALLASIKMGGLLGVASPRDLSRYNHTFDSDSATTSTNFAYEATYNEYVCLGTNAGVLETATTAITLIQSYNMGTAISKAFMQWGYYIFTVYDECSDSSVDTGLWDTNDGSITEDTSYMEIGHAAGEEYVRTDATNGDFYGTNDAFAINWDWSLPSSDSAKLQITDGTNAITLITRNNSNPANGNELYYIKLDSTNNKAYVWSSSGEFINEFDISSASKWQIEVRVNSAAGVAKGRIYYLRKITGNETTAITTSFSSNNGTNYTASSDGFVYIVTASERMHNMKAKLTSTPASGEGIAANRIDFQGFTEND